MEVFIGALVSVITLVTGGYGILYAQIRSQSTEIAKLNAAAIADKDKQIAEVGRDRDYFRDMVFSMADIAQMSTQNTRKAMDARGYSRN